MRLKTLFRWLLLLALILSGWWLAKLIWLKPLNINHFYERVFIKTLLQSPETVYQLRIPYLSSFYKDQLSDESATHYQSLREDFQKHLEVLNSYDEAKLNASQKLSSKILRKFLEQPTIISELDAKFPYHNYPIKQMDGLQSHFPDLMINFHTVNNRDDAGAYIKKLSQADRKFSQILERLRIREQQEIIPPRFVIEAVLVEMRDFISPTYEKHPLYTTFQHKLETSNAIEPKDIQGFLEGTKRELEVSVYPAYQRMISYFEQLEAKSTTDDGVWKFPNGKEYYRHVLKAHTTTNLTPEEVFELGQKEVALIEGNMRNLLDSIGLNYPSQSVGTIIQILNRDPASLYANDETGKQQCLADLKEIVNEVDQKMSQWFDIKHQTPVAVEAIPANRENSETFARYHPKAIDGSRPGTFFINFRDMKEIVKYGLKTLAYHEAVPGHHLQVSVQLELDDVPNFRKMIPFTAYSEGWALYAEQLAWEQGMYRDDLYGELGFWQAQMFRAVRLVVDVGIHYHKWTREQAIDYMLEKTGMTYQNVVTEVERYIVMPGQACAYKVGQLKILELRKNAQKRLGDAFDLKEFHNVVLQEGALPLDILEEQMEEYINQKLREAMEK